MIAVDDHGVETKHFHVRDGLAYALWHRAGKRSAILSGRRAEAVDRRAAELKIAHVLQGHDQKAAPFRALIDGLGLEPSQVCFVGDDLPDLPVLRPSVWRPARPMPSPRSRMPSIWSPRHREAEARSAK